MDSSIMPSEPPNEAAIFNAARKIAERAARGAYLADACRGDSALQARVERLLSAYAEESQFLEQPAPELGATLIQPALSEDRARSLDAGLAAAFGSEQAVVLGDGNHSVLKLLGQTLDKAPRVALRESRAESADPIVRPKSAEMPKHDSDSRYRLDGEIARGGMGAILKGRDTDLGRDLAIKVLLDQHKDKPEVVQRFIEEAQIGGQLQHPGVTPIYELGQFADKRPFFSMKLVKGETLSKLLADRKEPAAERGKFIGIFEQICQTMAYVHSRGVIHRDLKPANIMVGAFGEVQVMDWGLAKVLPVGGVADEKTAHDKQEGHSIIQTLRSRVGSDVPGTFGTLGSQTQMGSVMGTPAYMPPEQALGEIDNLDERADVFGLGAILCEILTGKPPYVADDGTRVYRMASRGKLEECFQRLDACGADAELIALTKHCLELEPQNRPRDAGELSERVSGYLESVETKLRETERAKVDAQVRAEELRRRQKLAYSAGAAIAASLLIGISVSAWQALRATRAEKTQIQLRELAEEALGGEKVQRANAETERERAGRAQAEAEANARRSRDMAIQARRSQYAADLFAASTQIDRGNYVTARNFLREYFPREDVEELRGFEWRYWWQLSAGQQLKTLPLTGQIRDMAMSPDGRLIAGANRDGSVKLLNPATGEMVRVLEDCAGFNPSIAFSHDGHGLATGGNSAKENRSVVHFWDVRDGRLNFTLTGYPAPRVACSPVGPLMAIGTGGDRWAQSGREVHLVDTTSGKEVRVLPKSGDRAVFSPDGKRIATANYGSYRSGSQAVILWDVETGEKLGVLAHQPQSLGMVFSPDGRLLAISARSGKVTLWNLDDFSHAVLRPATLDVARSVAFSPDGRQLAVGMQTHEVEIWDVPERRLVETLRGHTQQIAGVAYSPDGIQLASACEDGTIRFWDPNPSTVRKLIPGAKLSPYSWVGQPRFSRDSRLVAVGIMNGDVQIADAATPDWAVRKVLPKAGYPIAFSRDATTLLSLTTDLKTVHRWSVDSLANRSTTALDSAKQAWSCSATTLEGDQLALAAGTVVEIHELLTGRRMASFKSQIPVESLEFSASGQLLALAGAKDVVLWDIAAGRSLWRATGHGARISAIRFSPDEKMIATASWDNSVRLWDAAKGKPLATLTGHKAGALNCIFSPDGQTLISGSDDRTIRFWNLATLREIASIPLTHAAFCFAFSPDGQILVTNGEDASLRCWRAPSLAEIDAGEAKERAEKREP